MKFSDKKAVGRLQPITLGGTRIYTSYTGGKPWPGSGSSAAWPNFFRFGQHRRHYSAATAPLPPPLCAANRGILYYFFCNKTSHRQRSPCSKSETIAQNLLRERLVRERERVIVLSILRIWTGMLWSLSWPPHPELQCTMPRCMSSSRLAMHDPHLPFFRSQFHTNSIWQYFSPEVNWAHNSFSALEMTRMITFSRGEMFDWLHNNYTPLLIFERLFSKIRQKNYVKLNTVPHIWQKFWLGGRAACTTHSRYITEYYCHKFPSQSTYRRAPPRHVTFYFSIYSYKHVAVFSKSQMRAGTQKLNLF